MIQSVPPWQPWSTAATWWWQSSGQDGNSWGIYGRHFTAAYRSGVEFRLSDYVWNAQQNVSVRRFRVVAT